jgi:DNA-binding transcriptional ArsR family regulator
MPNSSWPPPWFDPERYDLLTPVNVSALAHPIRMSLLRLLREDGPATASGLAVRVGHSSGVTSYHLRTLAEAGLVVEDTERGNRRDRWWKAVREGTVFSFRVPDQAGDHEQLEAAQRYVRMVMQVAYERVLSYVDSLPDRRDELPDLPWQLGEQAVSLTHDEARELAGQVQDLVSRYRRDLAGEARGAGGPDEHGAGRERAVFQFQLMPDPHGPAPTEPAPTEPAPTEPAPSDPAPADER